MQLTWNEVLLSLVPFVSAQLFVVFLVYLALIRRRIGRAFFFYACFLVSLIVFWGATILRILPLETSYDHGLYVRFSFLFGLGIPSLLIAMAIQTGRHVSYKMSVLTYGGGILWMFLYILVRDFSRGQEFIGLFGLTHDQVSSWGIARGHAHIIQMVGTLFFLMLPSLYFLLTPSKAAKPILFLASVLSFSLFMMIGTGLETWWILYAGSIVSALFWGAAVLRDLQGMKRKVDNLAPWISEELLQNISTRSTDMSRLRELFSIVDMTDIPNRFLMIKPDQNRGGAATLRHDFESIKERLDGLLRDSLERGRYLLLPSGSLHIGLCICGPDARVDERAVVLGEQIRAYIQSHAQRTVCVGIGRHYTELADLRYSYEEAFAAVQYAARQGEGMVVTYGDIRPTERTGNYPFREREHLLQVVRTNSSGMVTEAVGELLNQLNIYCHGNLAVCRLRIGEVLFLMMDVALASGAKMEVDSEQSTFALGRCSSLEEICHVLEEKARNFAQQITEVAETSENVIVERARVYLTEHYAEEVSVNALAKTLSISSSYLMAMFKKSMGQTVHQYLTGVRIEKAKILLLEKSVTETAFAVGFNTSNYFSTVFKKQTGQTPKQYQQQAR